MRVSSSAALAAATIVFTFTLLICAGTPRAQMPSPCPYNATVTGAINCAIVETVQQLKSDASDAQYVYTSGYMSSADGGGGVLYQNSNASCSNYNNGTIVQDGLTGHCYTAQTFPQNVLQWGAYCDAKNPVAPGVVGAGGTTFVAPSDYTAGNSFGNVPILSGEPFVITGAGSGSPAVTFATTVNGSPTPQSESAVSATFTNGSNTVAVSTTGLEAGMLVSQHNGNADYIPKNTIIVSVNAGASTITISNPTEQASPTLGLSLDFLGTNVTLHDAPSTSTPIYVATGVSNVTGSGHSYSLGDVLTLTDGTQVQVVKVDGSGNIKQAQVLVQAHDTFARGPMADTYGSTYTLRFSSTGQFWYGHDDSAIINTAIQTSEKAPGSDIYLPANRACGVTHTVELASGANSLRGLGSNSSGIVALASMGIGSFTYVLQRCSDATNMCGNVGATGGGARELYVEGNMLATDTCGVQGGQNQVYDDVACRDGTDSAWLCGGDTTPSQMTNNLFLHILGEYNYNAFPVTGGQSAHDWNAESYCTWASIIASKFHSGLTGIEDGQSDWNVYTDDNVTGSAPFNASKCAELTNRQHITNLECDNPITAAVHVAGNNVVVEGVSTNWDDSLAGAACTVLIDAGTDYDYISGVQSHQDNANGVAPGNVICPLGSLGPNTIITGNPEAAFSTTGPSGSAPLTNGQVYFSNVSTLKSKLCPFNGPGGLSVNGTIQSIPATCAFLFNTSTTAALVNYIYARADQAGVVNTASDGGLVKLTVSSAQDLADGNTVTVAGVTGTTEANGTWIISNLGTSGLNYTFDLVGSAFVNTFACTSAPCGTVSYIGLTASTSTHSTVNGVEVNSADSAQTLVGMAYMDSSQNFHDTATKRDVASWYNRQRKQCLNTLASNSTVTSTTYAEISTSIECEFVNWGPPGSNATAAPNLDWAASGQVGSGTANDGTATSVAIDPTGGITAQTEQSAMISTATANRFPFAIAGTVTGLSEARHVITLAGKVIGSGSTGTWYQAYASLEADPLQ